MSSKVLPGQKVAGVPFTLLGVGALAILTVMALTSWDLFPTRVDGRRPGSVSTWRCTRRKPLIVFHFTARFVGDPPGEVGLSRPAVAGGARRGRAAPGRLLEGSPEGPAGSRRTGDGLVFLGHVRRSSRGPAATVHVDGERVAVVRKDGALWAISNVCPHQNWSPRRRSGARRLSRVSLARLSVRPVHGPGPARSSRTRCRPTSSCTRARRRISGCPPPPSDRGAHDHEAAVSCKSSRPRLYKSRP
jgi:hypothetical protein